MNISDNESPFASDDVRKIEGAQSVGDLFEIQESAHGRGIAVDEEAADGPSARRTIRAAHERFEFGYIEIVVAPDDRGGEPLTHQTADFMPPCRELRSASGYGQLRESAAFHQDMPKLAHIDRRRSQRPTDQSVTYIMVVDRLDDVRAHHPEFSRIRVEEIDRRKNARSSFGIARLEIREQSLRQCRRIAFELKIGQTPEAHSERFAPWAGETTSEGESKAIAGNLEEKLDRFLQVFGVDRTHRGAADKFELPIDESNGAIDIRVFERSNEAAGCRRPFVARIPLRYVATENLFDDANQLRRQFSLADELHGECFEYGSC